MQTPLSEIKFIQFAK